MEALVEEMEMICRAIDSFIALYQNVNEEQFCRRDFFDICFKKDALEKALCITIKSSEIMEETDSKLIKQMADELYFCYKDKKAFIKGANFFGKDMRIVLEEFYLRCLWLINNQEEKIEIRLLEDIFIQWEYFFYFGGGIDYPKAGRKITKDLLTKVIGQFGENIMDTECFRKLIMKIKSDFGYILNRRTQKTETGYHQKHLEIGAIEAKVDDYIGQAYTIYYGVMYSDD